MISHTEDHVNYLTGVSAVNISSKGEVDHPSIQSGSYSLVFGSLEACSIMKDGETEMLVNHVYRENLRAVAVDEDNSRLRIYSLFRIPCHFPILSELHITNSTKRCYIPLEPSVNMAE